MYCYVLYFASYSYIGFVLFYRMLSTAGSVFVWPDLLLKTVALISMSATVSTVKMAGLAWYGCMSRLKYRQTDRQTHSLKERYIHTHTHTHTTCITYTLMHVAVHNNNGVLFCARMESMDSTAPVLLASLANCVKKTSMTVQ